MKESPGSRIMSKVQIAGERTARRRPAGRGAGGDDSDDDDLAQTADLGCISTNTCQFDVGKEPNS